MTIRNRTFALVTAVSAAAITSGCSLSLQGLSVGHTPEGPSYRITAEFDGADRVVPGAEVRAGQDVVGRVSEVSTRDFTARLELRIRNDVPVPQDVTARIELPTALGNPFVRLNIEDGSGVPMDDGDVIPLAQTSRGPDIESGLAALATVLNGSGIDQMSTIMGELSAAFAGRSDKVRDLVDMLNNTLGVVDDHRDELNRAIVASHAFSAELAAGQPVLDRALTEMSPVIDLLVSQREQITALMQQASTLAGEAERVLGSSGTELSAEIDHAGTVLTALEGFESELAPTLDAVARFLGGFAAATPGDYVTFNGTFDVTAVIAKLLTGSAPLEVPEARTLAEVLGGGVR
ncbi:MCE family protein [Rhodococcus tibetensis]|uniref:MCE family protein n=1 Tax=Rhodococcus tibetensis TaxID=2965064 RepID=A0ABT1QET4_9NOCA|nr:MCE family protein [Rhodococcus sp. FXJ9.536]MCQ4120178.1 MCE family protein [Rhodococcus sp. FXJ9.536]